MWPRTASLVMALVHTAHAAVGSWAWARAHQGQKASGMLRLKDDESKGGLLTMSRPFNQHAMIMAHDASTTYIEGGLLHPVNDWAKTQPDGGFTALLNCGARAFDFRAKKDGDRLVFHHGGVTVPHDVDAALGEIIEWSAANATALEDIVLVHSFSCEGEGCDAALEAAFAARNISYVTDCAELGGLTLQGAAARGKLPGGGSVLAVKDCLVDHYQPEVTCSGYAKEEDGSSPAPDGAKPPGVEEPRAFYTCYRGSSSKAYPLDRMWSYLANVSAAGPPANGYLYSHQALWQESPASVAIGVTQGSNLLQDEESSGLNALLSERVGSGVWDVRSANLVEVNNVCDGGLTLLSSLRKAQGQPAPGRNLRQSGSV